MLCAYEARAGEEVGIALHLLDELFAQARSREKRQTIRWIRNRISHSLLQQAKNLSYINPSQSRRLLATAVRLDWRRCLIGGALAQIARLLTARVRGKIASQKSPSGVAAP